ncbi:MAG: hypothetical protein GEU95_03800 [Rhizobiales bacterium]|nr:hypothetical protein [Hyphomicrobiales bacterium]
MPCARRKDIESIAQFFRTGAFARRGATITTRARRDNDIAVITAIAGVRKNRIVDIVKWTPCTEVYVVFESSQRADPLIEAALGDFTLVEAGRPIPVECYFMPKAVHDPALEVADFVMHAVGRRPDTASRAGTVCARLRGRLSRLGFKAREHYGRELGAHLRFRPGLISTNVDLGHR